MGLGEEQEVVRRDDEDYDTIGGLVYERLSKVPSAGDVVNLEHATIRVLSTKGRQVQRVHVTMTEEPSGGDHGPPFGPISSGLLIRQVVVPLGLTYVAFIGAMALRRRGPSPASTVEAAAQTPRMHPRVLLRHVAVTLAAGYVVYLGLVVSYYAIVAYQTPQFLRAAVSGGAFITFGVALPGLLLFCGAEAIVRRRSNRWRNAHGVR